MVRALSRVLVGALLVRQATSVRAQRYRPSLPALALMAMVALPSPHGLLDTATVPAVTAAFLFNFVKFTEWPSDALSEGQRLRMCVAEDAAVGEALDGMVQGQSVAGHQLHMATVDDRTDLRSCHVLYVGAADLSRSIAMVARVQDAAVFTVGRAQRFAARGGVGELILESERMRFAINLDSVQRAHLRLSSRLLRLAEIIKGSM
jgi:hypothetical protein